MPVTGTSPFGSVPTVERVSTAEQVAEKVREMILSGQLQPNTPLKESEIAAAFSTSRNTVRETLLLLTHEGLVQRSRNKGAVVAVLTPSDIRDMSRARKVLELTAIDAFERDNDASLTPVKAALDRLIEVVEQDDGREIPLADALFHRALVSLHRSDRLMGLYDQLWTEIRLATMVSTHQDAEEGQSVVDEHQKVYDLLRECRYQECRQELERMIDETEQRLLDNYASREQESRSA